MTHKAISGSVEFPALVIAAFVVRNAGVLLGLSALAFFILLSD